MTTAALLGAGSASPAHRAGLSGRLVFEESSTPCPSGHCRTHITVMNADGSGRKMLTTNKYSDDASPQWSPNGRLIAFSHAAKNPHDAGLKVMKADGSGQRLLSSDHTARFGNITWAANGKSVLYLKVFSHQKCRTCATVDRFGVMAVNVAGKPKPHRLFMLPGGAHPLTNWSRPTESPDGNWIVLDKEFFTKDGSSVFEIWLVHPNGKGLHRLLRPTNDVSGFAWSPDSKQLAYAGFFPQWQTGCPGEDPETDDFETIYVVGVRGGTPKPMWHLQCLSSPAPTDFLFGSFNPITWADARHIVYSTSDWTPRNSNTPANEEVFALVLHAVDVQTDEITGIPNSRQSSDNCHGPGGGASSACLLVDPDWTK